MTSFSEMELSDNSDNEDQSKSRRGRRRKLLQQEATTVQLEAARSALHERKTLAVYDHDEQSKRTSKLIDILRIVPAPEDPQAPMSLDPVAITNAARNYISTTLRQEQGAWLANLVDGSGSGGSGKGHSGSGFDSPYWLSTYMDNLPDFLKQGFHQNNIPERILGAAADAMISNAADLSHLMLILTESSIDMDKFSKMIGLTILRKTQLLRLRIDACKRYAKQPKNLDEESIWGLKPLRYQLTAPYLKTSDGMCAAPAHPTLTFWQSEMKSVPTNFDGKQNWLAKDISTLKDSIRDFLVERKLFRIKSRAEQLMKGCMMAKEEELEGRRMKCVADGTEEEEDADATKRKGRPRKHGRRQNVFATITPTLFTLPNGIVARYQTNNADIQEWCDKSSDAARKLKYAALLEEMGDEINWQAVSNKVTARSKKKRSALDCFLAFKHEVSPEINGKRWSHQETKKLQGFVTNFGIHELEKKAGLICNNRTEFQCFQRWKNVTVKSMLMNWDSRKDNQLKKLVANKAGNWKQIAFKLEDDLATKNRAMDRFKKSANPILKAGQFTRVEDALLILTIEKLKAHLAREGHFGELVAYLPWRFETVWRDRAANLFASFIVPWTIDEDNQLLELAGSMNRDWRRISETFKSFKNRKGCLTRWKILQKRLKKFGSVEAYHESYSLTRYNVFQYKHLNDILDLLNKIVDCPLIPFAGMSSCSPPTEEEVARMLLGFNRTIMRSAIESLRSYVEQRDGMWKDVLQKVNDRQKTFDRRTFHRELPQSMASAIHIRGLALVPMHEVPFALTEYQEEVYTHYARFTHTKSLKRSVKRPYIPSASQLALMAEVKDIVKPLRRGKRSAPE